MKLPTLFFLVLAAAGLRTGVEAEAGAAFYLMDGDRVVFYGDSITEQRLYSAYVESFVVTRFPRLKVTFVHSGWGGDRVSGGGGGSINTRLKRDVVAYRPSVVTIMLGMNDGAYRPFDGQVFEQFTTGYDHILEVLGRELPGARLTLITPSPHDDVTRPLKFPGGYNAVMARYSDYVKGLAGRTHATVADFNAPLVAVLQTAFKMDTNLAVRLIPDRVHPAPAGQLAMAGELLKAWGAPGVVSKVRLDGGRGLVAETERCAVSGLRKGAGLEWDEMDESLPMPADFKDPLVLLVLTCSDFVEALDRETLQVTGLDAPSLELRIDGERVGVYTRENLAAGINLATVPTPMLAQAMAVQELTVEHNDVHFARWRQVEMKVKARGLPALDEALGALDRLEAEILQLRGKTALPVRHHFELVPESKIFNNSEKPK